MADPTGLEAAALLEQIEAARARAAESDRVEPRASAVRYRADEGVVELALTSGLTLAFAPAMLAELGGAGPAELAELGLTPFGDAVTCPPLDVHIHVAGLLADLTGLAAWWQLEAVRRAGRATSDAKARAARVNGQKGGRPRKSAPPRGETLAPQRRQGWMVRERPSHPYGPETQDPAEDTDGES
ncbi:MAG: hypothetical protein JWM27_1999 [Gemmatimonadetes bacterium]|nr:hypothetical protein [Gemmatimonadota bacterium]